MTRDLRPGSATDPVTRGQTIPNGSTSDPAVIEPDEQNHWPAADSRIRADATEDLDTEIGAAAKALFLGGDLVRPGPGPLPFGAKARDRRVRRRDVDTLAAARRTELEKLLTARRTSRSAQGTRSRSGAGPRVVSILLISVVIVVAAVGWWMSAATSPTAPTVESADTASAASDPPGTGSVWVISPDVTGTIPAVPDSIWPEGAAASWLAAWCPVDPTANPDTVARLVREAMTPAGWEQFSTTPGQLVTEGGMAASCDEPVAQVVSRPPGDATVVVVLVSATRTVTDANGTRQFRIERRQFVVRGDGGLWRVDTAAVGG